MDINGKDDLQLVGINCYQTRCLAATTCTALYADENPFYGR